jgi:hypothetical protein
MATRNKRVRLVNRTLDIGPWTLDCFLRGFQMATYTPPPYFPQGSLAPPDKNRYKKFKLIVAAVIALILLVIGGVIFGLWSLIAS